MKIADIRLTGLASGAVAGAYFQSEALFFDMGHPASPKIQIHSPRAMDSHIVNGGHRCRQIGMEKIINANATAYLVLIAAPSSVGPPSLPAGTVNMPRAGQFWRLFAGKNLMGRQPNPGVAIVLPWVHVSRRHAEIEWFAPGNWEIEDLHSRNGTCVNGKKLPPHSLVRLNDGDHIQLSKVGDIELLFCFQVDPAIAPSAAADDGTPETVYR